MKSKKEILAFLVVQKNSSFMGKTKESLKSNGFLVNVYDTAEGLFLSFVSKKPKVVFVSNKYQKSNTSNLISRLKIQYKQAVVSLDEQLDENLVSEEEVKKASWGKLESSEQESNKSKTLKKDKLIISSSSKKDKKTIISHKNSESKESIFFREENNVLEKSLAKPDDKNNEILIDLEEGNSLLDNLINSEKEGATQKLNNFSDNPSRLSVDSNKKNQVMKNDETSKPIFTEEKLISNKKLKNNSYESSEISPERKKGSASPAIEVKIVSEDENKKSSLNTKVKTKSSASLEVDSVLEKLNLKTDSQEATTQNVNTKNQGIDDKNKSLKKIMSVELAKMLNINTEDSTEEEIRGVGDCYLCCIDGVKHSGYLVLQTSEVARVNEFINKFSKEIKVLSLIKTEMERFKNISLENSGRSRENKKFNVFYVPADRVSDVLSLVENKNKISPEHFSEGEPIMFSLFLFLKNKNKKIKYISKGNSFSSEQIGKLIKGKKDLHFDPEEKDKLLLFLQVKKITKTL